jgi:membrane protein implicated in regulation of membrane protease activity
VEAILWIVLGLVLAIAEAFTASLFIIFFAVGALAAAGVAALGAPLLLQVIVFAVSSGLSVAALRPIVARHLKMDAETEDFEFGIEALQGGHGTVLEEINVDRGMIKIDGELWQARAFDHNEIYLPGERVRVIKVIGATAIVWREDTPNL